MIDNPFKSCDILIIGGGNAALCAAITAKKRGDDVVVIDAAPKSYRGGNSRHTRNLRIAHSEPIGPLTDSYSVSEYFDDLMRVTEGHTNQDLARMVIEESQSCYTWMKNHGVYFQPSLSGTLSLSRTNAFFLGGGKTLINAYYRLFERIGGRVFYETKAEHIGIKNSKVDHVILSQNDQQYTVYPKAVIAASGGFQANIDWLANAWGEEARNFLIRGTPYNQGYILKDLIDQNIQTIGDPTQCHAVAIDGRALKFDSGIATRLDCVPFSIVVNNRGERFYDEGEDIWPKRYAIWGRLIAKQPDQVAYAIIDQNSIDLFMPSVFPPIKADTLEGLAKKLGLSWGSVKKTIDVFNRSCQNGIFRPTQLDGLATQGILPEKSNWARPINTGPFYGYELRPGVTFTYLSVAVDKHASVQYDNKPMENLWAAGEIMAGNILGKGYLAGLGMTIGTVFGKIAGEQAANYVKRHL